MSATATAQSFSRLLTSGGDRAVTALGTDTHRRVACHEQSRPNSGLALLAFASPNGRPRSEGPRAVIYRPPPHDPAAGDGADRRRPVRDRRRGAGALEPRDGRTRAILSSTELARLLSTVPRSPAPMPR
jgi:hypothetical protein